MPILTLSASKDTYLNLYYLIYNFGSSDLISVRSRLYRFNGLLEFSLSLLPVSIVINSATMSLYFYDHEDSFNPAGSTIRATLLRRTDWSESQATWNIYKTGSNWGDGGAENTGSDINTSYDVDSTIPSLNNWQSWDLKEILEYQISQSASVMGIHLNQRTSNQGSARYYSREYATDTSLRPKLVIDYTHKFSPIIMIS